MYIVSLFRLVHVSEFRDEVEEYTFPNTTYPWEFFRGSFAELGDESYHKNRVLLSEEREIDDTLFESSLGKSLNSTEKFYIKIDFTFYIRNSRNTLALYVLFHFSH